MITGLMDDVCPPSTQYAIYNKLTCEKRHISYPDYGHEGIKTAEDKVFMFLLEE
jgi:cephalosporin-C deacetylase